MPANFTPDYRRAEDVYRQAKTAAEKIDALEEMLRLIPKHKGTDHVQGELKSKLAKLRESAATAVKGKSHYDIFHLERHGAGQILVVGMANTGKSALVGALTNAKVTVAAFPFSTHAPVPGMMPFEDIQLQLVDMPPFAADGMMTGMAGALRCANALVVCLDLSADDLLEQVDQCLGVMAARGILPIGQAPVENAETKPMLLAGTKADLPSAAGNLAVLRELRPDLGAILPVSAQTGLGLGALPRRCFDLLDIVRVYTKEPGKPADLVSPYTLRRGGTVLDVAAHVHRELASSLRYARVWGSGRFDGQTVQRDHVVVDKDIVELHT